jgi:hypothetical protein
MPPTVQQGSTGDAVTKAQYLLVRWLILPSDQIDGSFGPATSYSPADEIAKLAKLRDEGKITAEEYEDMKKKAMMQL